MWGLRRELQVLPDDITSLNRGCLVNGLVVNGYLRLIERRSLYYQHLPCVWACDSSFLSDWIRGGYEAVQHRVEDYPDLFSRDLLLFPIHLPHVGVFGHWSLVVVRPKVFEILAYDSLGYKLPTEMRRIRDFLKAYRMTHDQPFHGSNWSLGETPDSCPRQEDSVSCGVYVCAFAELLSRGVDPSHRRIVEREARKTIAGILRKGRFDNEDFSLVELDDRRRRRDRSGARTRPVATIDLCCKAEPTGKRADPATVGATRRKPVVVRNDIVSTGQKTRKTSATATVVSSEVPAEDPPASGSGNVEDPNLVVLGEEPMELEVQMGSTETLEADAQKIDPGAGLGWVSWLDLLSTSEEETEVDQRTPVELAPVVAAEEEPAVGRHDGDGSPCLSIHADAGDLDFELVSPPREPTRTTDLRLGEKSDYRGNRSSREPHVPTVKHRSLSRECRWLASNDLRRRLQRTTAPSGTPGRERDPLPWVRRRALQRRRNPATGRKSEPEESAVASERAQFEVPDHIRQRLVNVRTEEFSNRQKKNQRWRVWRPDGTSFRIRTTKLKRLSHCY